MNSRHCGLTAQQKFPMGDYPKLSNGYSKAESHCKSKDAKVESINPTQIG
jgi:hypothetical protein